MQNNTQTMLLPNQPFLEQLQQNNQQQIFEQKQQSLVYLQENNRQKLLINQSQQPLLQSKSQMGVIPGQIPFVNRQQTIPFQIINETPISQPQINNIKPRIIQNQIPVVQPQLNNIQPEVTPNQTPVVQPQVNNIQPANIQNQQTNIENNKTNANLVDTEFIQTMIDELKESEYAIIEYFSYKRNIRLKIEYNCKPPINFEIFLGRGDQQKFCFKCTEISGSFQRNCVEASKREFDMDIFYNHSNNELEFIKDPRMLLW